MRTLEDKIKSILGLTDTETAIYLAALSYPSVGVSEIVKLTSVKLTTAYHALDSLVHKGLMAKKGTGSRMVFSVLNPHSLKQALEYKKADIEEQQEQLTKLVPELEMLQKGPIFSTQVQHFQGVAGVKAVYEELLNCKAGEWQSISPLATFLGQYGEQLHKYVNIQKDARGIKSRVLWEQVKADKPRSAHAKKKRREVRVMPPVMQGKFRSKIFIFDNKIAMITPPSDPGAILITSKELHAVFKAMFESIWQISTPIKA